MMADDRASVGGNICAELQGVVGSCDVASNSLFKDILARKDEADAKRNVLNILHRFRFLFNLQRSIERNIQQGEYEILISDYSRAKALFQNTQVKSFQKALAEVDKKVAAFSLQLKHKLFNFPTPLEDQKKIIRYLNDLDYPGNAGLECINKQALWIKSMLLDCHLEHQNPENQPNRTPSDVQTSRSSEGSLKSHSRSGSDGTVFSSRNSKTQLPECLRRLHSISTHNTPHSILMVEELCELISRHVSDFWNLGQTYLSNQLGDKRATVEKSKLEKEKFQETVKDVIIVFCEMVQSVLLPDNTAKTKLIALIPWLPGTVQAVKSTLDRLNKLGLTSDIIAPLNKLTSALISECIRKILSIAIQDINELFNQEFWDLDFSEESYCLSKLPGMFEKIAIETLQFVHEFMVDTKAEGENNALHKEVSALLRRMFEEYILSLEKTVYPDINNSNEMLNVVPDGTDSKKGVSKDMQYLVLLSNCEHSKKLMLPRIVSLCVKYGHNEIEQLNGEIMLAVEKLNERVFSTYIELKSEILAGAIDEGMFVSEFCYSGSLPVTGIRHYIQDVVMKLVAIHYEVSMVSSTFVSRIFNYLIEKVCTEVSRVFLAVQKFSEYGSVLANLELNAIKAAFGNYINQSARKSLEKAIACIPSIDSGKKSDIDSLLSKFKTSMHYQLSIFENPDESTGPDTFIATNIRTSSVGARSRGASCGERSLANAKHKKLLISRNSPLVTNEIEAENTVKTFLSSVKTDLKSIPSIIEVENSSTTSEESPMPSESRRSTDSLSSLSKKTKRQAPAPPPTLAGGNRKVISISSVRDSTNPFTDDSGNPFLDSSGASHKEGSTNPFFGDD